MNSNKKMCPILLYTGGNLLVSGVLTIASHIHSSPPPSFNKIIPHNLKSVHCTTSIFHGYIPYKFVLTHLEYLHVLIFQCSLCNSCPITINPFYRILNCQLFSLYQGKIQNLGTPNRKYSNLHVNK